MTFLRNRWYAGAWTEEFAQKPLGRKILGENITFFRTESGKVAAVASRCPHRFAPLHLGKVLGENLKCIYHGLQFGTDGGCKVNPDGSSPPAVGVKSYPIVVTNEMVWVWIGEKQPDCDPPAALNLEPHLGGYVHDMLQIDGNYQLVVDNLLDSAHATHLHAAFETPGHQKSPIGDVRQEGDFVFQTVQIPDSPLIPAFQELYKGEGNVDMVLDFKWQAPSTIVISAWATPVGGSRDDGFNQLAVHMITPETEKSCLYFWALARSAKKDDLEYSRKQRAMFQNIFLTEDKVVVEGQEAMIDDREFWSLKPAMLPQDKATGLVRRHNDKLLTQQKAGDAAASA